MRRICVKRRTVLLSGADINDSAEPTARQRLLSPARTNQSAKSTLAVLPELAKVLWECPSSEPFKPRSSARGNVETSAASGTGARATSGLGLHCGRLAPTLRKHIWVHVDRGGADIFPRSLALRETGAHFSCSDAPESSVCKDGEAMRPIHADASAHGWLIRT